MESDSPNQSLISLSDYLNTYISSHNIESPVIALQFPDSLLPTCTQPYTYLQSTLPSNTVLLILGDTSYGECCVDQTNAFHYSQDISVLVHFGRTCLTVPKTLHTIFVLEDQLEVPPLTDILPTLEGRTLVTPDLCCQQSISSAEINCTCIPEEIVTIPKIEVGNSQYVSEKISILGRHIYSQQGLFELKEYQNVLFVGKGDWEHNMLFKAMLTNYAHQFKIYTLDVTQENASVQEVDYKHNRFLMKRYGLIEKIKQASIIGIIMLTANQSADDVGDNGDHDSIQPNSVSKLLQNVITKAGKKYYELLIGKINEAKLENFLSIDIYVLVACRESSFYYDEQFTQKCSKPVVTPYELLVALHPGFEWETRITTDYHTFMNQETKSQLDVEGEQDQDDIEEAKQNLELMKLEYGELANVFEQATIERFKSMTFQGLEIVQDDTPAKLENGKVGIATQYQQIE